MDPGSRGNRRLFAILALGAFLPLATLGCFGRFELTRKVYRFNQEVSPDKWIQWLAFLGMNFVPIYSFAGMLDVLFANPVEFWTGDNPIQASAAGTRTVQAPDGRIARATAHDDGSLALELTEPDGTAHHLLLLRQAGWLEARDAEGTVLARVFDVDGMPRLFVPR